MKKLLFIILLLNISILSYSLNFSVAPTGFSVGLSKPSTHEITILNNTTEPLRLNAVFHSDPAFGEDYNLNSNLTVFPKTISLKPAGKQTVRFRVKPDSKLENGEYKSLLTFTEVPGEIKTTAESNETSSNLKFITEINISVYGYKGDLTHKGTLSDVKLAYNGASAVISASSFSEGNTSLKFSYSLKVQGSNAEASGLFGISAREGNKDLSLSTQLGPNLKGKKAKLVITDQDGKVYYDKVHTL
ncbi:COG1470 family protein [Fusobacterium ulcerans]|uniref:COG1470 family protein n=1 Tax=Fusobacterium ulcerans TaxID=861 RepID=UPI001D0B987A|nr:molecular chaperone [Fusobacterium ulcerans]MCB8565962.1 molecular chaperone [Fusobacterium ulcerans]MCB8647955.1 molecular chaperone [Fusobacterium ulcerans]